MDFEEIYRIYFHEVFLYTKSLCSDDKTAEETTQETFFKAMKSIQQFDGSKDIRAWLFTIARNTYFTHYNKQKRLVAAAEESVLDQRRLQAAGSAAYQPMPELPGRI